MLAICLSPPSIVRSRERICCACRYFEFAHHDLRFARHVPAAERKIMAIACRQLARKAAKLAVMTAASSPVAMPSSDEVVPSPDALLSPPPEVSSPPANGATSSMMLTSGAVSGAPTRHSSRVPIRSSKASVRSKAAVPSSKATVSVVVAVDEDADGGDDVAMLHDNGEPVNFTVQQMAMVGEHPSHPYCPSLPPMTALSDLPPTPWPTGAWTHRGFQRYARGYRWCA